MHNVYNMAIIPHQCEDAWTQVMDLCDSLGQTSLKEEVQNYKFYADNPQQGNNFQ